MGTFSTLATTVVVAAGALAAFTAPTAAQEPLKVGLLLPFSGQYAWVGGNVQPVAEMVAAEVAAAGGIGGRTIAFVQGDTEGVVDAGAAAAQKLINLDGVLALIGPTSLTFAGANTLILESGTPMVTPTAGTTALDRACQDVCFRTVPSDSLGGRAIARAATDAAFLGGAEPAATPVLMVGNAPALISFQDPVTGAFADYGTPLADTVVFTPGKPSYRSEVQTALAAEPDLIVLVANPEDSARIMTNAFQSGYAGRWFVTQDQTNAEYIALASAQLVEGIFGLEEIASEEGAERNRAFEAAVEAFSGEPPKIFATNTYDAMTITALAILRAHLRDGTIDRTTIANNIRAVANAHDGDIVVHDFSFGKGALEAGHEINYEGLVGPVDFNAWGNITAPFGIRQVRDGAWVTVATMGADALN